MLSTFLCLQEWLLWLLFVFHFQASWQFLPHNSFQFMWRNSCDVEISHGREVKSRVVLLCFVNSEVGEVGQAGFRSCYWRLKNNFSLICCWVSDFIWWALLLKQVRSEILWQKEGCLYKTEIESDIFMMAILHNYIYWQLLQRCAQLALCIHFLKKTWSIDSQVEFTGWCLLM